MTVDSDSPPVAVPTPAFLARSPLIRARDYANRELKGRATDTEVTWLYEHPLLWLRALTSIRRDVQYHIAKDRAGLAQVRPRGVQTCPPEYLVAKAEFDERTMVRTHVLQLVENRADEVKALLGPEPAVGHVSIGELIGMFEEIAVMADEGDLAAAADKARYQAKRIARRAKEHQS